MKLDLVKDGCKLAKTGLLRKSEEAAGIKKASVF